MEKILQPVKSHSKHPTGDLEVLLYGNGRRTSHCKLLPPPLYIHAPSKIGSYAVAGNGSHVCISVNGRGTYFLDTARHTWDKVGDWTLPFHGKAEYVPKLKLWFGLSADAQHLVAADLSTMDSQPRPVDGWKQFQPLEEWIEHRDAQLVNLGSGRFCISRFFKHDLDFVEQDDSAIPQVSERMVGELELEAIQEGRYLADFRYGCIGYSIYLDDKETPTGIRDKARAQLPVCAGVELLADRKVPTNVKKEAPKPRHYKPGQPGHAGDDFLTKFQRNAGLVANGVAKNLNRVGTYIKDTVGDMVQPYRKCPK